MFATRGRHSAARFIYPEFRTSATSSSHQIIIPATAKPGDLAILFDHADTNFSPPSYVLPTGWTEIHHIEPGGFDIRKVSSWRAIAAGDAGTTVTCMNGGTTDRKIMLIFSGCHANQSIITFNDKDYELTQGNPSSQTISAGSASGHIIVIGAGGDEDGISNDFTTESPAFTDIIDAEMIYVGYKIYHGAGTNHTIDVTDSGQGNYLESFYITIT